VAVFTDVDYRASRPAMRVTEEWRRHSRRNVVTFEREERSHGTET
jgi:hypothetical protein